MVLADIYSFIKSNENLLETKHLVKHPIYGVYIIITYLFLVKLIIPKIMKERKPYDMRWVVVTYNLLLSILNGIIAFYIIKYLVASWKVRCEMRASKEIYDHYIQLVHCTWYAWLTKYLELLDTIFFALRKKDNQISLLHLFHHSFIVLVWLYQYHQPYVPYYAFVACGINLSIHVVMYLYYGLAAFGPHMRKYLWWKKYLTLLQIMQFIIILGFALFGFLTGCEHVNNGEIILFAFVTVVLILFLDFYVKSYHNKVTDKRAKGVKVS
ncbi:very long chain fatty acid elongase 7 isoform X3 [Parasteatoda tepidariorum]|uniref:very long chain fatty acid elongase 7 isoform X3 n=1 Tax=Parasteatoda tepidariorum TaxID=114398 RepID=UPI001C7265B2|nr:elongation of very long chain fatty acids protein 7 isoform X3 [Parasteatoda tepidariorum]